MCTSHTALAQERTNALVLDTPQTHALAVRVAAELRSLGFTVTFSRAEQTPSLQDTERAAREANAAAVLRLESTERGIEVWAWDRSTHKLVLRELLSEDQGTLALRAVEVLRASLLEANDPPPHTPVETPPPVFRAVTPPRISPWNFSLSVGASGSLSPAALPPLLHATVSAGVSYHRWSAGFELQAPLLQGSFRAPEGESNFLLVLVSAWSAVRVTPTAWRWDLSPGLGVSLAWLQFQGTPAPGFDGASVTGTTALAWLRLQSAWWFLPRAALWIDVRAGSALQTQRVFFADRVVAEWGTPWMALGLGLSVRFL